MEDIRRELTAIGAEQVPVIIGGIIPAEDAESLKSAGVKAVFTPKDSDMNAIMAQLVDIIRAANGLQAIA